MAILTFKDTEYKYGFHVNEESTLVKTVRKVINETPYTALQTYLSNQRSTYPSMSSTSIDIKDLISAGKLLQEKDLYMCVHGSLRYNLCGSTDYKDDPKYSTKIENTCRGLTLELDMGVCMDIGIVVHIGTCKKKEEGIFTISKVIENVLTRNTAETKRMAKSLGISVDTFKKRRKIILENAAGEKNKIGSTLEDIASILKLVPSEFHPQVKVCIDTAHAFGAGLYHWGKIEDVCQFYDDFDRLIGLDYLEVFHLNDSRKSDEKAHNAFFGSHKDRHENLGLGYIFSDDEGGLKEFFLRARRYHIPIIGEPHKNIGMRDWEYVCDLLSTCEWPLVSEEEI